MSGPRNRTTKTPGVYFDTKTREYLFVVDVPATDGTGKRRQLWRRGYASMKAAATDRGKLLGEVRSGLVVMPAKLTLGTYLVDTWLPLVEHRVRPTTADTYRRLVRLHIVPALGAARLQQLQRAAVARWVVDLQATGLSAKSVRNIHAVLTIALEDALELGLVVSNVATRLRQLPTAPAPAPRAWSAEQTRKFMDHVRDDRWYPLWRFVAVTGCRRGEALGLRWDLVDLKAGTVTIAHQRTIAGGVVVEGGPKTFSGNRTIALDAQTIAALKAWRKVQVGERLLMGDGWRNEGWVFTWGDGTPLWPQTVTKWFRKYCDTLELPPIGVHGLRHTMGTWMISTGENPKLVQQRLGHSKVATTIGLYTHVMPGHDQGAVDAFGAALDG